MTSKLFPSARRSRRILACLFTAAICLLSAQPTHAQRIFFEDFDGLTLGPKVEEALAGSQVWTKTPPSGWVGDSSRMPGVGNPSTDGITEWAGWSFANKDWWVRAAGDQRRAEFTLGRGAVMIGDPDEWDDAPHTQGLFETTMATRTISLTGVAANSLILFYDSSWRPEAKDDGAPNFPVDENNAPINDQTGYILATIDGTTNEIQRWTSVNGDATYHDHAPNESVIIPLNNAAGAQNLALTFGMEKGANDWWWAVDNIAVGTPPFGVGLNADGVSFRVRIVEGLGQTVDATKPVTVELDGRAVTPVLASEDPFYVVSYSQAPQVFQPGTTHTVKVRYTTSSNRAAEDTFTFVAPGYTTATATPTTVTATITDTEWLTVDENSPIALELDGAAVTGATVSRTDNRVTVRFTRPTPFEPLTTHALKVTFKTATGATVVDPVTFTAPPIAQLPATLATALGSASQPGMKWRTHQLATGRGNTVSLAEQQLAGALGESVHDPAGQETDGLFLIDFVNFDQGAGEAGNFRASAEPPQDVADNFIPGIPGQGTDNIASEALAFVEIPAAGVYTMVVNSDDGFRVTAGTASSPYLVELGKFDGGRGAADSEFYFSATQAGVYLFRLLYFEGGSDARVEWFTVNPDGSRALVNGTQPGALKAYRVRATEPVLTAGPNRIFLEDFEGLTLGPKVEEALAGTEVWTKTPPTGWLLDDSNMPGIGNPTTDGIVEWAGWSFADKNWWITAAGDQRRVEFTLGSGTVMIADPDEWDDAPHARGLFESRITTREIPVAGRAGDSLILFYDSSWRPEAKDDGAPNFPVDENNAPINDQTGFIVANFDSTTTEVQRWTSVSGDPTYHDHAPNESIIIPLNNPAWASTLKLTIGMEKGANDWWWAVDNIAVGAPPFGVGILADGVSFRARIVEALGQTVDATKPITVELDGQAITPSQLSREEPFYIAAYSQSPQVFQPGTTHTVKVRFTTSANRELEDTFTFVAPGYTAASGTPTTVTATITDAEWLTVDENSPITVELDGGAVTGATVSRVDNRVIVRFTRQTAFDPLSTHTVKVTFKTVAGATVVDQATFTAPPIVSIPATLATAVGTGAQPGMKWRTHQLATGRGNTIALAEQQLAGTLGESVHDTAGQETDGLFLIDFVNFDQGAGEAGNFRASAEAPQDVADNFIPGIPGQGTDNIAAEARAFVEIPAAGLYTMVVNSDDGFLVTVGTTNNPTQVELGKHDGGRGAADSEFYFRASQAGVYFFRLLYFEGGSDASVEWFTVNADGSRALLNGTQTGSLKAFRTRTVPEPGGGPVNNITSIARVNNSVVITYTGTLKSSAVVSGPYTAVGGASSPHPVPIGAGNQFFIAE